jgi:hypothetical protein
MFNGVHVKKKTCRTGATNFIQILTHKNRIDVLRKQTL